MVDRVLEALATLVVVVVALVELVVMDLQIQDYLVVLAE
jgi:hypothetical protein